MVFILPVEFRTHIHIQPRFLLVYGVYQGSWGEKLRLLQDLSPPKVGEGGQGYMCGHIPHLGSGLMERMMGEMLAW